MAAVKTAVRSNAGVVFVLLGVSQLALGAWMALAPESFTDTIGGFGPFNPHYVRDVSTWYVALGLALVVAAARPTWRIPVAALALVQYLLHLVNHVVDVGDADPGWAGPLDAVLLAAFAVVLAVLLREVRERT